jgi:ppGpp synthetase/RelA/SpoT-type nucleotidyltranferase
LIVPIAGRVVEIQLRTRLQHLWAEMSEAIASALFPNSNMAMTSYSRPDSESECFRSVGP